MRRSELYNTRLKWLNENWPYKMLHHSEFDYKILNNIMYRKRAGRGSKRTYNEAIIMADTETSKKDSSIVGENHIVAWTISIRAFNRNIVTLWGHRPDTMVECINQIHNSMQGEDTFIYFHNYSYDYVFLRRFLFVQFGTPDSVLNTNSHYPINMKWENGIIIKDSLILAQRKLEKWAKDLNVEHQKAVGCWDYDKIRNQNEQYNDDELLYIENDTLAGVECLQATMDTLNKSIYSMPLTATGIPRETVKKRGKANRGCQYFKKLALTYIQQIKAEMVYHGGYTHSNRHYINRLITGLIQCYDFASSYPYCCFLPIFSIEKFTKMKDCKLDRILENMDELCFMFKLILIKPSLKDDHITMPVLQYSKCAKIINPVLDNGRVLCAEYAEIYLTEYDAALIAEQYDYVGHMCVEVEAAKKGYLPKWLRDYIYELFIEKTKLKGGDPVLYSIKKAALNSIYGLFCQKPCKPTINENYDTGEYTTESCDTEELYNKYVEKPGNVLCYQWGCQVTARAMYNLHQLGKCVADDGIWIYSDTDSCYATKWDEEKLKSYNEQCIEEIKKSGYGPVLHNGKEYHLGVATMDGEYTEYKVQGAKRYCGRSSEDGELHITVAGVPKKKGATCLDDDINNFAPGFIFSGKKTGKMTHTYFYIDEIYTDKEGNITGDSIDLSPCDYLLNSIEVYDWEEIFKNEILLQVYDAEEEDI